MGFWDLHLYFHFDPIIWHLLKIDLFASCPQNLLYQVPILPLLLRLLLIEFSLQSLPQLILLSLVDFGLFGTLAESEPALNANASLLFKLCDSFLQRSLLCLFL